MKRLVLALPALILAVLPDCGPGSSSETTSTPPPPKTVVNTAPVTVGFGALGPSGGYVNGIWVSVTVCAPGSTANCQTIPNVLVDTGSVGLRLLSSSLTLSLPSVTDSHGDVLQECVQFADFDYVWGPVAMAGVEITGTGEEALEVPGAAANSGIPIQIIAASPAYPAPSSCLAMPTSPGVESDLNTLSALGANGILGIGLFEQDCGSYCTSGSEPVYFYCPSGVCTGANVTVQQQLWNPAAAFGSTDTNGVLISLPSVPATGAASVNGSIIFGIGTQSDNQLGSAQIYEVDEYGNFPQVTFNGVTYASPQNGSFLDTGSDALFVSDAASLASKGIVECGRGFEGYYCPASTISFTATVYGANNVHNSVPFSVANAIALFNTGLAVFSNLAGDSGVGPSTDYMDFGLPFFLGRPVFVGIAGSTTTYPNGYWAF